jgi:peptide deformylase
MIRDLRFFGDPVLREPASPFPGVDDAVRGLGQDMVETMREEKGVGLAAQQIGLTDAICVVEVPPEIDVDEEGNRLNPDQEMPMVLLNPEILERSDESWILEEGCLSFPGILANIERPVVVKLRYLHVSGEVRETRLVGFVARVVQHEVDHLNGVLFTDRMTHVKKVALAGKLKRMRKETKERLGIG